jgi:hypothetical protein
MSPIKPPDTLQAKIQTVLLSIIAPAIIGCFTFLWNLNRTVAVMQEQNAQRTQRIDNVQMGINDLRLDLSSTKEQVQRINDAVIRVEEHQNNNSDNDNRNNKRR